ncbi:carbohydrate sulfotransferase 15-like [Cynoglossus semilaevis]|uniref:Sulfotransferase n=1 Tax=Cynoglossus semilaevis TaxID=244447 RepID=A0A3P8W613_CYNSE|nr:carbohydrate sulfotransferase 15-like [Cynoglossus semilaevis]
MSSSLTNQLTVSKIRLFSFFIGLALILLIIASYGVLWYHKGFLFTPTPYQPSPMVAAQRKSEEELTPKNVKLDMKSLMSTIGSKIDYSPRSIPKQEELVEIDTLLSNVLRRRISMAIKSPCWYAMFKPEIYADVYKTCQFTKVFSEFKTMFDNLWLDYEEHLRSANSGKFHLRCLPYFYIIGQPMCGTEDMFQRLRLHPEIQYNIISEPNYWTWRGFGQGFEHEGVFVENIPPKDYLNLFDLSARMIHDSFENRAKYPKGPKILTGEASPTIMSWNNHAWSEFYNGWQNGEPKFMTIDFINLITPAAKFIAILRNPIERLYFEYMNSVREIKTPEDFHQNVQESLQTFHSCLSVATLRNCVYNDSYTDPTFLTNLKLGIYVVFLKDWLTVFPKERILIVRLEDYRVNLKAEFKKILTFLDADPFSEQLEEELIQIPIPSHLQSADKLPQKILPSTRQLLYEFYHPFNDKLANLLDNKGFVWNGSS